MRELSMIFNKNADDIFEVDTRNCLTLILDNDSEIPLYMYCEGMKVKFLKIYVDAVWTNKREIIISAESGHCESDERWVSDKSVIYRKVNPDIPDDSAIDEKDQYLYVSRLFNGYTLTNKLFKLNNSENGILPAIDYALSVQRALNGHTYQGYIPAAGELKYLFKYQNLVNWIFYKIGSDTISDSEYIWSSNERSWGTVWCYGDGKITDTYANQATRHILPFFKKID